jgi:hypothetical protein
MSFRTQKGALAFLLVVSRAGTGQADASAENRAAAQALFDQGRALIKDNRAQEACPKFEESQRLDPGIGTQLNLADCYERTGKTASAWTLYLEVASAARQAGQNDRAAHAAARAAALRDKLSRLVIIVPKESQVADLVVERGPFSVGEAQWGAPMPVDPGSHTIRVRAPGRVTWQTIVAVAPDGSTKTITVPSLEAESRDQGAASNTALDLAAGTRGTGGLQRTAAYVVGAFGLVGVVVGSISGGIAVSKKSAAGCDGNVCPSAEAKSTYEGAQTAGTISTIAFVVGGAALATSVVLYFTAPKRKGPGGATFDAGARLAPGTLALTAGARW